MIGVMLIALSLLTLLSLLSFVPGEPKVVATPAATMTPPTHNLIGSVGAVFSSSVVLSHRRCRLSVPRPVGTARGPVFYPERSFDQAT